MISVADMACSIDDRITRAAKDFLQLPMKVAIQRMNALCKALFEGAESAGWLQKSNDPQMGGNAFMYQVKESELNPMDQMNISYWVHYDGVNRAVFVNHTITR